MKKILIIANGTFARNFLNRLLETKSNLHHYIVVSSEDYSQKSNYENFTFYQFDPTSLSKLKSISDGYFSQFCIVCDDKNEAIAVYENLRHISTKTETVFMSSWELDEEHKEIFAKDKHLDVVDIRDIAASRLMDYLPDLPVLADNIGLSEGEIMEVKVPIGSSYMYRHISSVAQKKWRIALIYRGSEIILPKPNIMIQPSDILLIVGDPNMLQNVYRSIKRESGQFPSPFGSNIYVLIDMISMDKERVSKLIKDSLYLHSKLNNKRLFFRVINPTLGENLDTLKAIKEKNIIVLMDYFNSDNKSIKHDVLKHDIGLILSDNKYFFKFKKLFYELKLPVLKTGKILLSNIKEGVILGDQSQEVENQSAVITDCCAQLDLEMKFYYFDNKHSDDEALREHFESISALFSKRIKIENHNLKNPLVKLKNTKDLLHFVMFSKSVANGGAFAFLSTNLNRLYKKLSQNAQLFVPVSE